MPTHDRYGEPLDADEREAQNAKARNAKLETRSEKQKAKFAKPSRETVERAETALAETVRDARTAEAAGENEAALWDELLAARRHLEACRRLVAAGKVGASTLHTAKYALSGVLRRLDALGWQPPSDPTPEPRDAA